MKKTQSHENYESESFRIYIYRNECGDSASFSIVANDTDNALVKRFMSVPASEFEEFFSTIDEIRREVT